MQLKQSIYLTLFLYIIMMVSIQCSEEEWIVREPKYSSGTVFVGDESFKSPHGSTITALDNGDILCAWYAGTAEKADDVAVLMSRLNHGETTWTPYEVVADTPDYSEGNPVLFQAPDGVVWLWYLTIVEKEFGWSGCYIKLKKSYDNGYSWTDTEIFRDLIGYNTRNHPTILQNGDWLLPLYDELYGYHSVYYISPDQGDTWEKDIMIGQPNSLQPTVFQKKKGTLISYMRNPDADYLITARSEDNGRHWTDVKDSQFNNPNSSAEVIKLDTGNVAMVLNNTMGGEFGGRGRSQLSVVYSTDDGESWPVEIMLQDDPLNSFSYPSITQDKYGDIYISYTFSRKNIDFIVLNEAWIRENYLYP